MTEGKWIAKENCSNCYYYSECVWRNLWVEHLSNRFKWEQIKQLMGVHKCPLWKKEKR